MRALVTFVVLICSIAAGHVLVLFGMPSFIMDRAMSGMEASGVPIHEFRLSPRRTPQNQTVVRPSPDLAYSICLFDFGAHDGPVDLYAAPWHDYASISLFDAQTDNFARARGEGGAIALRLLPPGSSERDGAVVAPSERGIVLIRRLAPTLQAYRTVETIAVEDRCTAVD